jgi:hypothetical protein
MRRWRISTIFLLLFVTIHLPVTGQTTCSNFNTTKPTTLGPTNNAQHVNGTHGFAVTAVSSCTYTHGNTTNCNTECTVEGSPLANEAGALTVAGPHKAAAGVIPGSASATNGAASCTGLFGAAAIDCSGNSNCTLSVTVATGGVTAIAPNGGAVIWNSGTIPVVNNCLAVKDPQTTTTHIPGCQTDCPAHSTTCIPCGQSPIVIDLDGNGFHLTDAANGVRFDISGTGNLIQMGWTAAGSNNAFLALPGADGQIHNGQQLFGNFTPQPPSDQPNGFAALAAYDDPNKGGNGDGIIDARDAVFALLRLWVDDNHDGISQPEELHTLPSLGVNSISLNYKRDDKTDEYGNAFRYRTRINPDGHTDVGKKAYDIFFVVETDPNIARNNRCVIPGAIPQIIGSLESEFQEERGSRLVGSCYETARRN